MNAMQSRLCAWLGFALVSGSAVAAQAVTPAPLGNATKSAVAMPPGLIKAAGVPVATVTYSYDSLGRLIQDVAPSRTGAYTYDNVGNRTQATQ